jgi:hypothetical protein
MRSCKYLLEFEVQVCTITDLVKLVILISGPEAQRAWGLGRQAGKPGNEKNVDKG